MKIARTDSGFVGRSIAGWSSSRLRGDDEIGVRRLAFRRVRFYSAHCGGTSGWRHQVVSMERVLCLQAAGWYKA
jgi:hypothetical protein